MTVITPMKDAVTFPVPPSHKAALDKAREEARQEWDAKSPEQRQKEAEERLDKAAKAMLSPSARILFSSLSVPKESGTTTQTAD